ncbi:DNA helicase RecQ [Bacillus coahuilensis]|uniref:DNA helicase RecQ n=1 Tax=Bacillus coahuilensis TaxID=408580 RepID=UPI000A8DC928
MTPEQLLQTYFGYPTFRPGQKEFITSVLKGHNSLAVMPTGGGKSICYQIPGLMKEGTALIISPLISLMKDQVDALKANGISSCYINSSLSPAEQQHVLQEMEQGLYKFVYVAPERFQSFEFIQTINRLTLNLIAFDEAHCISQWGHDFRPSYRSIMHNLKQLHTLPVLLALTATATREVVEDIQVLLDIQSESTVHTGFKRTNLSFHLIKGVDRKDFLKQLLVKHQHESGIIYCPNKKTTEQVHHWLQKNGYTSSMYHGGLQEWEREQSQSQYVNDEVQVMVATNAFGMGIDKSNVRFVIHYGIPMNLEAYYQEAGRAGRDGEPSDCYLLASGQDFQLQKFLVEQSIEDPYRKKMEYTKLQQMIQYCYIQTCLQQYILDYFNDEGAREDCGRCSNCLDESVKEEITREAQMILSTVKRMGERFGSSITAKVLKGSKSQKVYELKFHHLTTFGLLSHFTEKDIASMINFLVAEGILLTEDGKFPTLRLSPEAVPVLKGERSVFMKIIKVQKTLDESFNQELFERLRGARKKLADEKGVPPYVVFSDATLKELARYIPTSRDKMLHIKGVGERKLDQFGEVFLDILLDFTKEHPHEPSKATASLPLSDKEARKNERKSHLQSFDAFQSGQTIKEIAKARGLSAVTIENHLFKAYSEGEPLDLSSFYSAQMEQEVLTAYDQVEEKNLSLLKKK